MVRKVLMVAYHFPPLRGSSGIQRTLKFSSYLPDCGWEPIVLTAHPRAYESVSSDQMGDISPRVTVSRAFAFDTARHLAVFRRYPRLLALPDRWVSWLAGAIPAGLSLVRRHRPDVIWSTYPIATAHLIGWALHRLTGLPWVADMRDPMTDDDYPSDRLTRSVFRWIENLTVRSADAVICTTPGAVEDYRRRFPGVPATRFRLIENGYDEEVFSAVLPKQGTAAEDHRTDKRFTLLHSGIIYPSERDPSALFAALGKLRAEGMVNAGSFRLVLRATAHDDHLRPMLQANGIADLVDLAPPCPYREALGEMLNADGLLLLQAANCNRQVPAKLYEYLRARRPVLALTDPAGDTASTLLHAGAGTIARLDDADAIRVALIDFIKHAKSGSVPVLSEASAQAFSRRARTRELAAVLDACLRPNKLALSMELGDEKPLS
ncbi:glycosyltransferase family 4 protein [Noviherbaspirillum sp. 17J57-3]|uniref:Glycosyltransferase family 4 protein n=2 Tax=Noviherbaspirillum galbum TaxID=2709383 RepID=A0A6B3SU65_9BURK|nr:glycosyltransferase family 4 protein [Noviherbaspirillum galbum]